MPSWRSFRTPRELGVFFSLLVVGLGFEIFSSARFLEWGTWANILAVSAETGVVAIGATLLMIAGEFDLSVGSVFAFAGMLFGLLTVKAGFNSFAAAGLVLGFGAAVGALNGLVTVLTEIPSFITTLGALLVWRGLVLAFTQGWPIAQTGDPTPAMRAFGGTFAGGLPASVCWWLAFGLLAQAGLVATPFGNWLQATGGRREAARACGVPVGRVRVLTFMAAGFLAALSGMLQFSRLGSFSPTYGEGLELEAIVASVIGGTALAGGQGSVLGTLIGTILVGMISSGLVLSGAPVYWFRTFVGLILVGAVILNRRIEASQEGAVSAT